jgi:uncharacterized protein YnzC (UPF0291/DUF896 family)
MEIYDQYLSSLRSNVSNYIDGIGSIDKEKAKDFVNSINTELNEKIFPYNNIKMDLVYTDATDKKHVFSSIVTTPEDDKSFIDSFDIKFNYRDNTGKSCNVDCRDILKNDFKDLHTLFSKKQSEFEKCYLDTFRKAIITAQGEWSLYGGNVLIAGNYIIDENDNFLSSEDGDFIIFE